MLDKEEGCLASAYAIQRYPKKRNRNCGWHDRQRARKDGEPMEDSVQHQTAEFGV